MLRNFPALWEQVKKDAEEALEGGTHGAYSYAPLRSEGTHSDFTAERALQLAEMNELADLLALTRKWIDEELPAEDRRFLLSVWRSRHFGWWLVARETKKGVMECRTRWAILTQMLADWMVKK